MTADAPTRRSHVSLRSRIAILTALAVGIAITLTTITVYVLVRNELYDQFDADLVRRTEAIAQAISTPAAAAQFPAALGDNAYVGYLEESNIMNPTLGGTAPPSAEPELAVAQGASDRSLRTVTEDGQHLRVAAVPAGSGGALVLAQATSSVDETLSDLTAYLIVIGLFGVAAAGMLGYVVARTGLQPVGQLTAATEHVARTEELTPIEVTGDDELARLAESFNAMLTSLDTARERERRLVADAGHELRTPLTSIRTNLELLAQANTTGVDLPQDEKTDLLNDVVAQIGELSDTVDDLVQLSRGGPTDEPVEWVDLATVVARATERVRRRAPGLHYDVTLGPWWLVGHTSALERAATNILDNAAKWSPPGGHVDVVLSNGALIVTDEGPGIPEADRTRVFERFYRSAAARGTPGSGLGLAIVAQTAQLHGGSVTAGTRAGGGAQVTLSLPGASEPPADH